MPSVVSVWPRWGDYVLGVRDVRPGESLSVDGRLLVGFRGPTALVNGDQPLAEGESSCISLGGLEYTLICFVEAKRFARARQPLWLFGAAASFVALQFLSTLPASLSRPKLAVMPESATRAGRAPLQQIYQLADPVHDPAAIAVGAEPRASSAVIGGARCGDAEMGRPALAQTGRRYGVRGPRDNQDPHLARPQPGDAQTNRLETALLPWGTPLPPFGSNAPVAPWGRQTALGSDESAARGQMWGDELGANRGEDGVGRQGWPGRVSKRFEVAATPDAPVQQLRVLHTGLRVSGGRKMSEVGRSMAAHFADFRHCAEAAAPGELNAVELEFEVAPDGHARATGQAQSGLEQCLGQSLTSVAFPAGASAAAQVHYPLYFVPARTEPRPFVPPAAALEACDCS